MNAISKSPKQLANDKKGKHAFFPYYAGFSPAFVHDVFAKMNLPDNSVILDPWNGSGTTTQVASELNYASFGIDINPVMILVAKAKQISPDFSMTAIQTARMFIQKSNTMKSIPLDFQSDSLSLWFYNDSVTLIRNLELVIQAHFLKSKSLKHMKKIDLNKVNSEMAVFYVVLFRLLHRFLEKFKTSNPTWIKRTIKDDEKVAITKIELSTFFIEELSSILSAMDDHAGISNAHTTLLCASSHKIPLENASIDLVLTSPPYCTRIDYIIATLPELALLGLGQTTELRSLRHSTIGTPTIFFKENSFNPNWGKTCLTFLKKVEKHPSRASNTYYLKTYLQYFSMIFDSLREISRILKPKSLAILVVQDSFYKDIHLKLPKVFIEMAKNHNLEFVSKKDFSNFPNLAVINKKSAEYRKKTIATETVLILKKKG